MIVICVLFVFLSKSRLFKILFFSLPLRFITNRSYFHYINRDQESMGGCEINVRSKKYSFKKSIINYIFGLNRYLNFECGRIPSHRVRKFFYKFIWKVTMESKSVIYWGAEIRAGFNLTIGKGSIIGDNALLDARNGISIGDNVNFSSRVSIYTDQHDHKDPFFRGNTDSSFRVIIDDRVWVGPNVIILHSVHIGEGSVVAAGSVVTKDVPPFVIVAGIPAKIIGSRNKDLRYEFDGTHLPFY